jgi:putative transposase
MSRETDAGAVTVVGLCKLLGVSRAGVYAARQTATEEPKGALPATVRTGVPAGELLLAIRVVLKEHSSWGHRKVWATLRRQGTRVSRRRVAEVMKAHGEMQEAHAPRADAARPRGHVVVPEPNRRFATDLTTVWTRRDGLVAVVLTVDSGCRSVLDVAATKSQESGPVLATVERALERAFGRPDQVPEGVELRSDHGPQYTGQDAQDLALRWNLVQTFAPVGRPTGNALAERTIQTMKIECLWPSEFDGVEDLQAALEAWRRSFNDERPHQALGWKTPSEVRSAKLGSSPTRAAA